MVGLKSDSVQTLKARLRSGQSVPLALDHSMSSSTSTLARDVFDFFEVSAVFFSHPIESVELQQSVLLDFRW